jgi:hypothetical protein
MKLTQRHYASTSVVLGLFVLFALGAFAADQSLASSGSVTNDPPAAAAAGPKIQFSEIVYDFGKVDSGELVKHDFVFTNAGNQMLEISAVHPGCGCTAAGTWDKQVEPGKTGKIPIQFNSTGYGGLVLKTISVTCNDPAQANLTLQIKGTIWKAIDIIPAMAMFTPALDSPSNETRVIKIVNNQEEPLTLSELECANHAFRAELKTVREGKEFELDVTAVAPFEATTVWAPVTLKASSTKTPVITVNCYLNVQPLFAVVPPQIDLPAGPLTNAPSFTISIRNNGMTPASLSEPAMNLEGAELKLQEVQTGRVFNLTATFPVGFKSQPDQQMEATIKSSHPKLPVLKIPIHQMAALLSTAGLATNAPASTPAPLANAPAPPATNVATTDGPKIHFAEPVHDFGQVDSGMLVKYDYVFTNTGTAVLEVASVRPACGCTAAGEFDKRVEPGKTGRIPIQFDTAGYYGSAKKSITVSCNDPAQRDVLLQLQGNIFRPIEVAPPVVTFTPCSDSVSNETRVVKIVNNLEEPVVLSDLRCTNHAFQAELKTVREGKEFELRISAGPPFASTRLWTPILLKTSSSRMTNITVNCYLNVQPPIALLPSQITLLPGPLTNAAPYIVTIRNNTPDAISLSEPSINVQGAEVKFREIQPGYVFSFAATFPARFKSQLGQFMEASIKSSHPKYPLIKIPIIQIPGPSDDPVPASVPAAMAPGAAPAASSPPSGASILPGPGARPTTVPTTLASPKEMGAR